MRRKIAPLLVQALQSKGYVVVNGDGQHPTGDPVPLGTGGSSIVYRAIYRGRLHRALKIIIARDDLTDLIDVAVFAKGFDTEVGILGALSHQNVAKISDFGSVEHNGREYPFIATDYVDGLPIDEFCRAGDTTGHEILSVLQQLLSGLAYLHSRHVLHSDVKTANVLVRRPTAGDAPAVVLIDLGVAHVVRPSEDAEELGDQTYVFTTKRIVTRSLRPIVTNSATPLIVRTELAREFPWLDLHGFGLLLDTLLADPVIADKLREHVGDGNMDALQDVRTRLDNPRAEGRYFRSAAAARDALERLPFHHIAPLGMSELAPVPEKGVVLPTSRARVPGSARVNAIISHPLFQRLHHLPQLDLLHHVLPGATHTRFVHALHTYDLARTAICHQLGDWRFRMDVDRADIDTALFSALLDSVGRYHFQHMFEDFFPHRKMKSIAGAGLLKDDQLLDQIMSPDGDPQYEQIRDVRDRRGRRLCNTIECTGLTWAEMRRRRNQPQNPIQGFLAGLLDNPVDVDKLAYLIDDSAYSGLPFGQAVAPGPVFEAMRVPDAKQWNALPKNQKIAVAIREKALSYIEQAVLSRYWNIQTGYWYRTNRSLQAMVKFLIASLLQANALQFHEFITETLHLSANGAMRWLNERFNAAIRSGDIERDTVNPIEGLLVSRRDVYRRLVTISPRSLVDERMNDRFIYDGLKARNPLQDAEICGQTATVLESVLPGLQARPGEVLLDLQRVRREDLDGKILFYSDSPGATYIGELSKISPVLEGLEEQFDLYAKRLRIFIHPRLQEALAESGLEEKAHEAALDMLRSEFPKK